MTDSQDIPQEIRLANDYKELAYTGAKVFKEPVLMEGERLGRER